MNEDGRALPARAAAGDREAFDELVRRYQDAVYNFAFYVLRDPDDAMDVAQETFLQAYVNIRKYDSRYAVYTWLVAIARNLCRKRKRGKRRDRTGPAAGNSSTEKFDTGPHKLGEALEGLSRDQRMALVLRVHEGWTHAEIAAVMKKTEGTIKVMLFRTYEKLRPYFQARREKEEG